MRLDRQILAAGTIERCLDQGPADSATGELAWHLGVIENQPIAERPVDELSDRAALLENEAVVLRLVCDAERGVLVCDDEPPGRELAAEESDPATSSAYVLTLRTLTSSGLLRRADSPAD